MTFICFEGLRYVPRKEKKLPVVPETVIVFLAAVAAWRILLPKIINLLNAMCLFMKLIMND